MDLEMQLTPNNKIVGSRRSKSTIHRKEQFSTHYKIHYRSIKKSHQGNQIIQSTLLTPKHSVYSQYYQLPKNQILQPQITQFQIGNINEVILTPQKKLTIQNNSMQQQNDGSRIKHPLMNRKISEGMVSFQCSKLSNEVQIQVDIRDFDDIINDIEVKQENNLDKIQQDFEGLFAKFTI